MSDNNSIDHHQPLITFAECQEIVDNAFAGPQPSTKTPSKLLSYDIQPFGNGVLGFLGEYYRLIVQIDREDVRMEIG